ncbi:MAG: hypothetical protein WD696_12465 [Bryobacteraceae bacterium]
MFARAMRARGSQSHPLNTGIALLICAITASSLFYPARYNRLRNSRSISSRTVRAAAECDAEAIHEQRPLDDREANGALIGEGKTAANALPPAVAAFPAQTPLAPPVLAIAALALPALQSPAPQPILGKALFQRPPPVLGA